MLQLASTESSYSKELLKLSKTVDQKLWKKTDKEIGYTFPSCSMDACGRPPHLTILVGLFPPSLSPPQYCGAQLVDFPC